MGSQATFDIAAAGATEAASGPRSRAAFIAVCRFVELTASADRPRLCDELLPALSDALAPWPSRLKMAPLLWILKLIHDELPVEALSIVDGLSFTAAMAGHPDSSEHYSMLLEWLGALGPDVPAIEGLSLSMRRSVAEELRVASQNDVGHQPDSFELDEGSHYDTDDFRLLVGSPLARQLRVLDLSWSETYRDFDWDSQFFLAGRGVTLRDVAANIATTSLEVLDLFGQCTDPSHPLGRGAFSKKHKQAVRSLKVLNLGGGHPIGDADVRKLSSLCPSLEELSLRPGPADEVLEGYDFDEFDESEGRDSVYGRLREHWDITSNAEIARMRLTSKGVAAVDQVRRLQVGNRLPSVRLPNGRVDATDADRIGKWENLFVIADVSPEPNAGLSSGLLAEQHDNAELLAGIVAAPDDPAPYLAYAEWLKEHGDPLGELIALQVDAKTSPSSAATAAALLARYETHFVPGLGAAEAEWKWGFLHALKSQEMLSEELIVHRCSAVLRKLDLEKAKLRTAGLKPLAALTRLETLNLRRAEVTDADMRDVAALIGLKDLDLSGCKLTRKGLKHVGGLAGLEKLSLMGVDIGDAELSTLGRLKQLEDLDLGSTRVTDKGLARLAKLPNLKHLFIYGTQVQGPGLAHFAKSGQLRTLHLVSSPINDETLKYVADLPQLERLHLSGPLTNAGVARLKGLTALKKLYLFSASVTDEGLQHLGGLTQLKTLGLSSCALSDAGLHHLRGLVNLEDLGLSGTMITGAGFDHLAPLARLSKLNLSRTGVTDTNLKRLSGLASLEDLNLSETDADGSGLQHLTGTQLKHLNLDSTKTTSATLAHLAGLAQLETLGLCSTAVGSLKHLSSLHQLKNLRLSHSKVTGAGLKHLAGLTSLKSLDASYSKVNDAGLKHLRELKNLQYVGVWSTGVTSEGVADLRAALPLADIVD